MVQSLTAVLGWAWSAALGNSIALGDNDTGFKQNGDGVLDVYANSKQVMRFLNSGITSYMLFNMNAGASVSSTLTFKNGSGITSEKTGANPETAEFTGAVMRVAATG